MERTVRDVVFGFEYSECIILVLVMIILDRHPHRCLLSSLFLARFGLKSVGLKRGYEVVGLRTVSGTSIFPPMFFLFFGECVPRAVVVYICHRILHGIRMTTVNDWFTYRDLPNCKLTAHQNSQGTRRKRKVEGRRTRSRIDWGEAMSQCIPLHMLGNSLLFPEVWF